MLNWHNWHIELSSKCFLKCPRCPRTFNKGEYTPREISLQEFKSLFTPDFIRTHIKKFIFCGNLGDPIYNKDFLDIYQYVKTINPNIFITTITNGSYKTTGWWKNFREISTWGDEVIFSLDGWDAQSNENYRKNSDWNSTLEAIQTLQGGQAILRWSMIVFSFNQDRIEDIEALAIQNGCDRFSINHSSIFGSYYPALIDKDLGYDPLEPLPKQISNSIRYQKNTFWLPNSDPERKKQFKKAREDFRLKNQECEEVVKRKFQNSPISPSCLRGDRALYVDSHLNLSPCCWTAEESYNDPHLNGTFFTKHSRNLNLTETNLEDFLSDNRWSDFSSSLTQHERASDICSRKCTL